VFLHRDQVLVIECVALMGDDRQARPMIQQVLDRRNALPDPVLVDNLVGPGINGRIDIDRSRTALFW
jgi:hypothetical protein